MVVKNCHNIEMCQSYKYLVHFNSRKEGSNHRIKAEVNIE